MKNVECLHSASTFSRREFIAGVGVATAFSLVPAPLAKSFEPLYPPIDLSYFETPITPAPSEIHFGYAAITWGGDDRKAIEDIAMLGFPGIQLRSNVLKEFSGNSASVKELLDAHHLKLAAFSSGNLSVDKPATDEIATHLAHAQFVRDAGGLYLQVIGERPKDRAVVREDYQKLGRLLTDLGKRTADLGVQVGFHNHMNSLGERPEEVDWIFDVVDPRYCKLELDVAHCLQGGGDPVEMLERYSDRLLFLHIKDVRPVSSTDPTFTQKPYLFVELGQGRVDLPAVFATIRRIKFRGWAIVELDDVPDKSRTPMECAVISKAYLKDKLGYAI